MTLFDAVTLAVFVSGFVCGCAVHGLARRWRL